MKKPIAEATDIEDCVLEKCVGEYEGPPEGDSFEDYNELADAHYRVERGGI